MDFHERDFFKSPFTRDEIMDLLQGKSPAEMFSFKSPSFKALGVEREKLRDEDLVALMLKESRLIRRPVVRINGKVYFGADKSVLDNLIK